ncbi:hypothetical protein [Flavobacterium alvei]|uniref:hypothetical protein n=1 Tax=Flavobacterium alvei TaxID=2080416 RepID=UPI0026EE9DFE|nr:hypothetical protein [Flavobacterium alvei]
MTVLKQVINCEVNSNNRDKRKLEKSGIIVGKGLRQGMPLSPFLSNVFLKKFDGKIKNNIGIKRKEKIMELFF